jgi:hypothetical protein
VGVTADTTGVVQTRVERGSGGLLERLQVVADRRGGQLERPCQAAHVRLAARKSLVTNRLIEDRIDDEVGGVDPFRKVGEYRDSPLLRIVSEGCPAHGNAREKSSTPRTVMASQGNNRSVLTQPAARRR